MLRLIQPISKRNQVVQAMKEAILAGSILPGSSLVESKLAQELGAGIPLVREALIELEHQGFVQRIPYKGTTVTKLDPADIKRIFRLRVELEALAIEWAKENITESDLEELRQKISAWKRPRGFWTWLSFTRTIWHFTERFGSCRITRIWWMRWNEW